MCCKYVPVLKDIEKSKRVIDSHKSILKMSENHNQKYKSDLTYANLV